MITIFRTGDFDYTDLPNWELKDKPVRYNVNNLLEVASRTAKVDITEEGYLISYDGYDLINVVNNGDKIYGIYQNNVPVMAVTDDEGYYYMFGTPVSEYEDSSIDKTHIKKKVR